MTLINCTSCAGLLQAGDRFCSLCGAEQSAGSGEFETDPNVVWDAVEQKLRAATEGKYRVLTPDECVEAARREGPSALFLHFPLCGGTPPELGWQSLHLYADKVLPQLAAL